MDSPSLRGPRRKVGDECWEILFYKDAWKPAGLQAGVISFSRLQVSVIKVFLLLQLYQRLAGIEQTPINKGKVILRFSNCHVLQVFTGFP